MCVESNSLFSPCTTLYFQLFSWLTFLWYYSLIYLASRCLFTNLFLETVLTHFKTTYHDFIFRIFLCFSLICQQFLSVVFQSLQKSEKKVAYYLFFFFHFAWGCLKIYDNFQVYLLFQCILFSSYWRVIYSCCL